MDISFLNTLRARELNDILENHRAAFDNKRVLEIGGGTGIQAEILSGITSEIVSLEIDASNYRENANNRIVIYDGHHIPFPDNSFDTIFSSNVLEHIAHATEFQKELLRVLKPGGIAIHAMPTHWWKIRHMLENLLLIIPRLFWYGYTFIHYGKRPPTRTLVEFMVGTRHGEFGSTITELFFFLPRTWRSSFKNQGWKIVSSYGGGLFYTGRMFFKHRLPWSARRILARIFGSSVHVFVLQKNVTS